MISFLQGSTRCREHQTRVGMAQSAGRTVPNVQLDWYAYGAQAWWHGSVGRAHRSHRWGRWFESNCHHQQRRSLRNQASLLFLSLPHGGTKKNETPGTNFDVNGMTGSLRAHRSMCTVWRLDVYELPELMCTECWHGCERNELWVCTAW